MLERPKPQGASRVAGGDGDEGPHELDVRSSKQALEGCVNLGCQRIREQKPAGESHTPGIRHPVEAVAVRICHPISEPTHGPWTAHGRERRVERAHVIRVLRTGKPKTKEPLRLGSWIDAEGRNRCAAHLILLRRHRPTERFDPLLQVTYIGRPGQPPQRRRRSRPYRVRRTRLENGPERLVEHGANASRHNARFRGRKFGQNLDNASFLRAHAELRSWERSRNERLFKNGITTVSRDRLLRWRFPLTRLGYEEADQPMCEADHCAPLPVAGCSPCATAAGLSGNPRRECDPRHTGPERKIGSRIQCCVRSS